AKGLTAQNRGQNKNVTGMKIMHHPLVGNFAKEENLLLTIPTYSAWEDCYARDLLAVQTTSASDSNPCAIH
ncbi:MAG: hypothetical protein KAU38_06965, partial [Desulfobacterales bacterium]|nr:hypothetical protein [Desulfobacterales bacterium]